MDIKGFDLKNILKNIKLALPFGHKKAVGIQMKKDFARVVVLEKEDDNLNLPIMPFQIPLVENVEHSGQMIKDEFEKRGIFIKNVVVSVPIGSTLFRVIKVPKTSKKELEENIEWNIKEDLKTLHGETVHSYDIIKEEENEYTVLVVIAKKDILEKTLQILESAGLNPNVIDSEGIALINLAEVEKENEEKIKDEDNICIMHLDLDESYLLFFHHNITVQSLNFNIRNYEDMEADDKEEAVNRLINEIDYFFLTINEPRVIYVSGLASRYPEIEAYMQLKFAARFTLVDLNPAMALNLNIEMDNKKYLSEYNVPFALAYRGL